MLTEQEIREIRERWTPGSCTVAYMEEAFRDIQRLLEHVEWLQERYPVVFAYPKGCAPFVEFTPPPEDDGA